MKDVLWILEFKTNLKHQWRILGCTNKKFHGVGCYSGWSEMLSRSIFTTRQEARYELNRYDKFLRKSIRIVPFYRKKINETMEKS